MSATAQSLRPGPLSKAEGRGTSIATTRIVPIILILLYAAQCAWFIGTQSFTIDEPLNIATGLAHWHGNLSMNSDNPPAARLLCSVLLLGSRSGRIIRANPEFDPGHGLNPYDVAWRTRSMNVLLGVALGIALWTAARRYFSVRAANFALALFAFSPPLMAHFSIVGTDGIAALMIFVTALQVLRFRRQPTWPQALVTGVVLGGLLLAKLYTLPMFVLAVLLMALPARRIGGMNSGATHDGAANPAAAQDEFESAATQKWRKTAAALCISVLLLWASYGFDVSRFVIHDGEAWIERHGAKVTESVDVPIDRDYSIRLPAADYLYSIAFQLQHGREGHPAYLLGKVSTHGWRKYFPIAVALKWPTTVLVLAGAVVLLVAVRRIRLPRPMHVVALFPLAFFVLAIFSTVNIGDRYVLSVYPFVLLLVAALWDYAGRMRVGVGVLVLALALNAADVLRYAPDYLSYFTPFVPAEESWRYLSDSSLDWGQSLIALRHYQQQHPGEVLHVAFWTNSVAPELYGVEAVPFGEGERPSGTVIVSPGVLSGQLNQNPTAYRWVLQYPRKTLLNHTLQVFEVPGEAFPTGSTRDNPPKVRWSITNVPGLSVLITCQPCHDRKCPEGMWLLGRRCGETCTVGEFPASNGKDRDSAGREASEGISFGPLGPGAL